MTFIEPYRPQYHFTPPKNWLNDPNGLIYHKGEYHLFYQHNPGGTVWGPMHWGHAVSHDLVNWAHLPIALKPDEIGQIFSGTAVIDWQNTAGFGKETMVALFTHHTHDEKQIQSLAYSLDRGRTWQKYEGNPVLEAPNNIKNFRDPKVFWFQNGQNNGHWVMLLAAGNRVMIYTSPDLIHWEAVSEFGIDFGATCGVWETPELFELPVNGSEEFRWVLTVGIGDCSPAGGSGMQYFIGSFDGKTFLSENPKNMTLWVDWGGDFYAAQSWNENPDPRRIWVGWLNNWRYANQTPTTTWRGSFSIPREVGLFRTPNGIRLIQKPLSELKELRGKHNVWKNELISADEVFSPEIQGSTLEIIAEIQVAEMTDADRFRLDIRSGIDEAVTISFGGIPQTLFIDRSKSGQVQFSDHFPSVHTAGLDSLDGIIRLHVFVDCSIIEVFANDGIVVFTEQFFPTSEKVSLEFFADGGDVILKTLDIYELKAAQFTVKNE
jgi:fructan beta-fructosidase